jgi:hypothetical protein
MPTSKIYNTLKKQIMQLRPGERITRIRNITWLMVGIYQSQSVCLSRAARKIQSKAKLLSTTRRLSRFLNNPAIHVREWYKQVAKEWLEKQKRIIGEIRLIVDCTKVGVSHQLLMVSLAYRKRAIPIAWTWVKYVRGHSTSSKQLALLSYVRELVPANTEVILVGDSEFGSVNVMRTLDSWKWFYVMRQKGRTNIWIDEESEWKNFRSLVKKQGESKWFGEREFTKKEIYPVNIMIHWKFGEKTPWFLTTNLTDRAMALRYYRRRMWIEEMFGDMKSHGFDLEKTMLRDFIRLSRLTLVVALLYVWLISTGAWIIHVGKRHIVDRKDRRDLCIFQIGLRYCDWCFSNDNDLKIRSCYYH